MKKQWIMGWIILLINGYLLEAQEMHSVDKWMEYIEDLAAEEGDEERLNALYTELSYRTEHPFDLNQVTSEQLKTFPFLSDQQIQQLVNYREKQGGFLSLYELKAVEGLDFQTIELLIPFVHVGEIVVDKRPITVKNLLKYNSNELKMRFDPSFQQKAGYRDYPDSVLAASPNKRYIGEPFYTSVSYAYDFDDRVQAGFVAEKDAGEPFARARHKGFDFYSAHLALKDIKRLKTLLIGDYKLSFGQGLVVSNDFAPSRNSLVTQLERRSAGIRRHYSTNEQDFFRGVAATMQWADWQVSLFYSRRKQDASVDSLSITSLKTDGLHRLERDWEKRHAVTLQSYGGNLQWNHARFQVGATCLAYDWGAYSMEPAPKPYNRFYMRGQRAVNGSVNYLLKSGGFKGYGETAYSSNGGWATLNALQVVPTSYLSFLLLHRYYDRRYQALFGHAFSQNSTVQNEQGVYIGAQVVPLAHWKLSAYADWFRFPWLKYGVDAPSSGEEYMVQVDFTPQSTFSTYLRYKQRRKEVNQTDAESGQRHIGEYRQQRLRAQWIAQPTGWVLKGGYEGILYREQDQTSRGWMVSQSVGWKPRKDRIQLDLYAAWFHTDDYDTRIYSYEKNLLYSFYTASFYGEGTRLTLVGRWNLTRQLALQAKWAWTHYFDREEIGSGLELIEGSDKIDLYLLLRWKF